MLLLFVTLLFIGVDYGNNAEAKGPQCLLGTIQFTATKFAPKNWAYANGKILKIRNNSALFSLLGSRYGGNGRSTFALPKIASLQAGKTTKTTARRKTTKAGKVTVRAIICVKGSFPTRR